MAQNHSGTIRVSPAVLGTIASMTARTVPGVVGMRGDLAKGIRRLLAARHSNIGARIHLEEDELSIDLYIIVEAGADLLQVARQVQEKVAEAISALVGLSVREVNVYIHDIR